MKNKNILTVLFLPFLLLLAGCNGNQIDITKPQFTVSQPEYRSALEDPACQIGGVYFDFYNKADYSVLFIETRMNVYDRQTGKNAFTGCGTIISQNDVVIKSGQKRKMCIPLDDYITVISQGGYIIDQFYVSRIEYEDGRVWKDDFGLYAAGNKE